jgi:uncharacterized protein (DUF58 family)
MAASSRKYLDPSVLNAIAGLELKARLIVEGFVSGMHRSPFHGFSVEFAEHREYVPGDDVRFVDWKVYGKSDRYYIKQYEEETNLRAWVLVDCSESMEFGQGPMTKIEYARHVAAALAYLITQQQDAVGLCLFDRELRSVLPPASSVGHLRVLIRQLELARTGGKTSLEVAIQRAAEQLGRRSVVILVSDLLDRPESVLSAIRLLRHHRHEVIVFHLLDRDERVFPFERMTRFEGLEELPVVMADPAALRTQYLKELETFTRTIQRGCLAAAADFVALDTATPLDVALSGYLARRGKRR